MRKSWIQLYAPFLVLMMVQALFVAVSPSRGPQQQDLAALNGSSASGATVDPTTGAVSDVPGATVDPVTGVTTAAGGAAQGATGSARASTAAGGAVGGGGEGRRQPLQGRPPDQADPDQPGAVRAEVRRRQRRRHLPGGHEGHDQGHPGDRQSPNDAVDAILGAKGLATSKEDSDAFDTAAWGFMQKHYETYGRKIVWENVDDGLPDDTSGLRQVQRGRAGGRQAQASVGRVDHVAVRVGVRHLGQGGDPEHRRLGVRRASSTHERRPYRFDVGMDGTEAADHIAEYYCKKMADKNAVTPGAVIHPQIGSRGQVKRKLGIVVPEIEANVLTAKRVQSKVKACGGGDAPMFTYASDIEQANQQTQATVAAT